MISVPPSIARTGTECKSTAEQMPGKNGIPAVAMLDVGWPLSFLV